MKSSAYTQSPICIVGGGLTGLASAALLARSGLAVTVFEKAQSLGGRARTSQHSGFSFNQGAHAFYLHGEGEKLLRELAVPYSGGQPTTSGGRALRDGNVYVLPATALTALGTGLLGFAAKGEFIRLFLRLKQINTAAIEDVSIQDWVAEHVRHQQVQEFLLAAARLATYTNAPDLVSAGLVLSLLTGKVLYLDGGWQTLVDGLRQKAQEAGAHIITSARVQAVDVANAGYTVRLADGSSQAASAVVLATDPETASALVLDGRHETLKRWATQAIPAYAACLNIGLRHLPRPRTTYALGIDRPLYYSVHSAVARLAPEGGALVHLAKYLRPGEAADPAAARQELEALMDHLQPGWRAEVVEQYFLPHMVVSNAIIQARLGGLSGRPGPEVPDLPNLYVAGDWVGPEGELVEACFASARSASQQIIAHQQSTFQANPLSVL